MLNLKQLMEMFVTVRTPSFLLKDDQTNMKAPSFSTRLQHELDHLKSIFNETGAYMFTKDLEGRYTYANQAVLDLFGCSLSELQGQDDSAFFDLHISDSISRNDRLVLEQQVAIAREEVNYLKLTGEKRVYWSVKKPLYDGEGQLIGLCLSLIHI